MERSGSRRKEENEMDSRLLSALAKITEEEKDLITGGEIEKKRYTSGRNFVVDRAKMLRRGELIALRPHTRFVDFPLHSHNFIEVMYVCQGSITHDIGEKEVVVQAGDLLFLGRHTCHSIHAAGKDDVGVNFMILPEFFDTAFTMIDRDNILMDFISGFLRRSDSPDRYLHFRVSQVAQIQNLIENLIISLIDHHEDENRINQILVGLLFLYLQKHTGLLEEPAPVDYQDNLVMAVLKYIDQHYPEASLSELADYMGVSLPFLSRLINKKTGSNFKELLQRKRLQVARTLLVDTHLSVSDIVSAVGYENNSYFYRCFREKNGVSPKEYRELAKRKQERSK